MKKQILELLRELEGLGILSPNIIYYTDNSGQVMESFYFMLFSFLSEQELIQGLKDKIKELKK